MSDENKQIALVIEDNKIQAKCAIRIVEALGYEAHHVTTGEEAIDLFKTNRVSCALVDIGLAGKLKGYEAAKEMRQIEKNENREHCPMLAVTANFSDDEIKLYKDHGLDDAYSKPITIDIIKEALTKYPPI